MAQHSPAVSSHTGSETRLPGSPTPSLTLGSTSHPKQTSKTVMGLQGHSLIFLTACKPNSILAWAQEQ